MNNIDSLGGEGLENCVINRTFSRQAASLGCQPALLARVGYRLTYKEQEQTNTKTKFFLRNLGKQPGLVSSLGW